MIPSCYETLQRQRIVEATLERDVRESSAFILCYNLVLKTLEQASNIPEIPRCRIDMRDWDELYIKYILTELSVKGYTLIDNMGIVTVQWRNK